MVRFAQLINDSMIDGQSSTPALVTSDWTSCHQVFYLSVSLQIELVISQARTVLVEGDNIRITVHVSESL